MSSVSRKRRRKGMYVWNTSQDVQSPPSPDAVDLSWSDCPRRDLQVGIWDGSSVPCHVSPCNPSRDVGVSRRWIGYPGTNLRSDKACEVGREVYCYVPTRTAKELMKNPSPCPLTLAGLRTLAREVVEAGMPPLQRMTPEREAYWMEKRRLERRARRKANRTAGRRLKRLIRSMEAMELTDPLDSIERVEVPHTDCRQPCQ